MPTLVTQPERIALTGAGALECALGSQAWNGTIPDLAANPTNVKMNAANMMAGESVLAIGMSELQLRVPAPRLFSVRVKMRIKPMKAKSMQVEVMNTYLRVAPMFLGAFKMTISTAEKAVVNSARIQNRARLSKKAYVMAISSRLNAK